MYDKPLTNLDNTLYYDENGLITQRVGLAGGTISISGPVTIPGSVTVNSTPESPVHVHLTEMGAVDLTGATSLPISGSVSVSNFPATQPVTGTFWQATQPVSIASMPTTPVTGTVNIGNTTIQTSVVAEGTDAFNRLRVSEPMTLADYHHVGGENPEMLVQTSGSGSGSADPQKSAYVLSLGTGNGDYTIHQSRMYHHYLPGKSQLINSSFCMGAYRANTVKRIGYFDDYNGIFFEQGANGTLAWVERKTVGGVTSDTRVTQANWNKNTCNAGIAGASAGASNYGQNGTWTLDITKTQLIMMDFQWLGVGRLRVGFVHNGAWVVAHEFYHSNILSTVYWNQPSLPIRCEMRNTGTAVGTITMDQICSTVMSEGGYVETGLVNTIASALTGRTIVNGGDKLPVVAIRLKNSFNAEKVRGIVRAMQASAMITNAPVYMELMRYDSHTQVTGGTWVSKGSDSIVEYNITATASTGGLAVSGQFLAAAASKNITTSGDIINPVTNKRGFITQNYDSTESECYAIVVTALGSGNNLNIDCYASLQWSETR